MQDFLFTVCKLRFEEKWWGCDICKRLSIPFFVPSNQMSGRQLSQLGVYGEGGGRKCLQLGLAWVTPLR